MWYLFLFGVVVAAVFLVWDFRRKSAAREAASKQRFEEMLAARPPVITPGGTSAPAAAPEAKPASSVSAVSPKGRFLAQSETLIYRLLKAGIPDHEVFANATLASVVDGRNDQEARRLAQYRLDFVVCDKAMHVVAVVEIEAVSNLQAAGEQRFKADSLKGSGIRLVRFNAAALPRREEIRSLVCGHPAPASPAVKE